MVVAELATVQLVSIWFAAGALMSLIFSLFNAPVWLQVVVFFAVSAVCLIITRPIVKKAVNDKKVPTNADMAIGKTGIVTETIDNIKGLGKVKVQGSLWSAKSSDGSVIDENERVRVLEIKGVKLVVENIKNTK